jgi:N-methylhydantoinase A/oxoprolinase/acetone carboxylase beta subunit
MSKEVANLGFLECENAAILNASIVSLARKTIKSFEETTKMPGFICLLMLSLNDGTLLLAKVAARHQIRPFSSRPTNSMRGATFLIEIEANESLMVVSIPVMKIFQAKHIFHWLISNRWNDDGCWSAPGKRIPPSSCCV